MKIPHRDLAVKTLRAIVLEFVTRDGTDHSDIDRRVSEVFEQLEEGVIEVTFDHETESCNIARAESMGDEGLSEAEFGSK